MFLIKIAASLLAFFIVTSQVEASLPADFYKQKKNKKKASEYREKEAASYTKLRRNRKKQKLKEAVNHSKIRKMQKKDLQKKDEVFMKSFKGLRSSSKPLTKEALRKIKVKRKKGDKSWREENLEWGIKPSSLKKKL